MVTSFSELPDELIILIIGHLSLEERKIASEVCTKWNEIAFDQKFMRTLKLNLFNKDFSEKRKNDILDIKSDLNTLLKSQRKHVNIQFRVTPLATGLELIKRVLEKFRDTILWIKFDRCSCFSRADFIDCIRFLTNVRQIEIFRTGVGYSFNIIDLPVLLNLKAIRLCTDSKKIIDDLIQMAPNIEKLDILYDFYPNIADYIPLIQAYEIQLKCLIINVGEPTDGKIIDSIIKFNCLMKMNMSNLTELDLNFNFKMEEVNSNDAVLFFRGLKQLKKLKLMMALNDEVFETISTTCNLEYLQIEISSLNSAHKSLSNLKKLNELQIVDSRKEMNCELMKSFFTNTELFKLKKLSFKNVNLYERTFYDVSRCAPSLLMLKIENSNYDDSFLIGLCKEISTLTYLKLELVNIDEKQLKLIANRFPNIMQLNT